MDYTYNITFVAAPEKEKDIIKYIQEDMLGAIINEKFPVKNPELKKVIETGGEVLDADNGVSLAFSVSFDSEELAHLWYDHILSKVLESFHRHFGDQALYFITLLEKIL